MKRRLADMSVRLRDLADTMDQHAHRLDRVGSPGIPTYAGVVGNVMHALLWGVANLNADGLVGPAADADIARTKGE